LVPKANDLEQRNDRQPALYLQ